MSRKDPKRRYIIGIDEAGRGPLAGPVSVAAVAVPVERYAYIRRQFKKVTDSKKMTPQGRAEWFQEIRVHEELRFAVTLVGNRAIDTKGIAKAIRSALARSLAKLKLKPEEVEVLLDGSLFAPSHFTQQRTIIRGDISEKIISMASVVAKVHRDRHMEKKAKEYPVYGFEVHKGYGTKLHISKIKKHGPSPIHRRSFLTRLIK